MAKSNPRSLPLAGSQGATPRREYWRAVLDECRRSGLQQVEFCRQRGIPPGTLSCWKHQLAREASRVARPSTSVPSRPPARPAFLPVRIASTRPPRIEATNRAPAAWSGEIEIVMAGGRLVRVRGQVDCQWLAQVIGTLEASRC
jgi:hypothetical protein